MPDTGRKPSPPGDVGGFLSMLVLAMVIGGLLLWVWEKLSN